MAKDLPYFKFFCSEWNDGDITLESYKIQGLFINVCSYYWSNECDLSLKKLKKRFKHNLKEINELLSANIIKEDDGGIFINFLDEQLQARKGTSEKNSLAGKKSAEVRRLKKLNEKLTPVEITLNGNSTIKKREEKKREDKEDINEFWDLYHLESNKTKTDLQPSIKHWNKLTEIEKDKAKCNIKSYIDSVNDPKYIVKARTYLADKKFNDEFQSPIPKRMTEERWNTMNEAERVTYFKNSLKNG